MSRIKQDMLETTRVTVPISGGMGQSADDPIIIEDTDPAKSAYWEHEVIKFISQMKSVGYRFEGTEVISKNDRTLEVFKISWEGDEDNYYNFYFDATAALK